MSRLAHALVSALQMIADAINVAAALRAKQSPADAPLARLGMDPRALRDIAARA